MLAEHFCNNGTVSRLAAAIEILTMSVLLFIGCVQRTLASSQACVTWQLMAETTLRRR